MEEVAQASFASKTMKRKQFIDGCNPERYDKCNTFDDSGFCYRRALIQNYSNFKRSGPPSKFMFYENGTWVEISSEVSEILKSGFLEGKAMVEASRFLVDFLRMLVMDMKNGNKKSISWIDVNGNCFFPKFAVDEEEADYPVLEIPICHKVDLEIRIDENSLKRNRVDSAQEQSNQSSSSDDQTKKRPRCSVQEQSSQSSSDDQTKKRPRFVLERSRWANMKLLKEEDKTYSVIKENFLSGLTKTNPGATITAIHQCLYTSSFGTARLEDFRKQIEMMKGTRGESNVRLAWHGTSAKAVDSILTYGFGMPSKFSGSKGYGVGVYLSPAHSPQTSTMLSEADEKGEKHVVLCRIIMGNVEKVEAGSQQFHPSNEEFDSGVDDLKNPRWYIIWSTHMNKHILPVCVVSFKACYYKSGLSGGSTVSKRTPLASNMCFKDLLSEIKSSLSSLKTQELENLYSLYKVRKVAKDVFIKQLRLLAGDELLLSKIRKIQSLA